MQHYLVRHAHAVDLAPDAARPLSPEGRAQVARLGAILQPSPAWMPREMWHSPLRRARETATLLAEAAGFAGSLREVAELEPEVDPRMVARRLADSRQPIAVVGHEPHLGMLASLMVVGQPAWPVVQMRKCAVLALDGAGAHWQVAWHLVPELFV